MKLKEIIGIIYVSALWICAGFGFEFGCFFYVRIIDSPFIASFMALGHFGHLKKRNYIHRLQFGMAMKR